VATSAGSLRPGAFALAANRRRRSSLSRTRRPPGCSRRTRFSSRRQASHKISHKSSKLSEDSACQLLIYSGSPVWTRFELAKEPRILPDGARSVSNPAKSDPHWDKIKHGL
jgi:hypothetical protein